MKSPGSGRKEGYFATGVVVFLTISGILLRSYALGRWSLSGDEWFTWDHSLDLGVLPLDRIKSTVKTYPLNYLLTYLAFQVFGTGEVAARLFPCLLSVAALPLFYGIIRPHVGRSAAVMSLALLTFSPWMILYAQTARFWAGAFLFGMLAMFSLFVAWKRASAATMLKGCLLYMIAALFHPSASIILPIFLLFVFTVPFIDPNAPRLTFRAGWPLIGLILLVIAVVFLQFDAVENTIIAGLKRNPKWALQPIRLILATAFNFGYLNILLATFGLGVLFRRDRALAWYILLMTVMTGLCFAVVSALGPSVGQRYLIPIMPAAFLASGAGAASLISGPWRRERFLLVTLLALVFVPLMPSLVSYYRDGNRRDYRAAARYVGERLKAGDRVVCESHAILQYYLKVNPMPEQADRLKEMPVIEADPAIKGERLERLADQAQRLWVIVPARALDAKGFYSEDLKALIERYGRLETSIGKSRFDFHDNHLNVYLAVTARGRT